MEKPRGAGCGENGRHKLARQMARVRSQLLKQMFFLAGYSISLSPEIPKIKHKGSPWRLKTQPTYPTETQPPLAAVS